MRAILVTVFSLGLLGCKTTTNEVVVGNPTTDTTDTANATDAADAADSADATPGPGADATDAADAADGADSSDGTDGSDGAVWPPGGESTVCDPPYGETGNPTGYPFNGLDHTPATAKSANISYSFDCTKCPNGYKDIVGRYRRYIDDNATLPDPKDEWELWEFEGNAFTNTINAVDSKEAGGDGLRHEVTVRGYYFCPDPVDLGDMEAIQYWNVIIVYTEVSDPGVFGIEAGAVDLCFLGFSTDTKGEDIGLGCNLFWDPKGTWQQTDTYCRVGSTVAGRVCEEPLGQ